MNWLAICSCCFFLLLVLLVFYSLLVVAGRGSEMERDRGEYS